jgi:hypothetical protein
MRKKPPRSFRKQNGDDMQKNILTLLVIPLIASLTAQVAASEHHHTRTKGRTVTSEQWQNSNAYAAPGDIAVRSYRSSLAEGAMASSGISGY